MEAAEWTFLVGQTIHCFPVRSCQPAPIPSFQLFLEVCCFRIPPEVAQKSELNGPMGPLWHLALALLSPPILAMRPVAVALLEDALQDEPTQSQSADSSASASFLDRFQGKTADAKARLAVNLSPKEAATKSLERECVLQKAELFGRLYQKFGGQWDDTNQTALVEDVIALQEYEEQKDNAWARFSMKTKLWRFIVKGKKLKSIGAQLKDVNEKLSQAGFNYAAVQKRCKDFEDEDTFACMQEQVPAVKDAIRDLVRKTCFCTSREVCFHPAHRNAKQPRK